MDSMDWMDLLISAAIAIICSFLAGSTERNRRGGWILYFVLALIGAAGGAWTARRFSLPEIYTLAIGSSRFPVIYSLAFSALLVAVVSRLATPRV